MSPEPPPLHVVAIIPCRDGGDSIFTTVRAIVTEPSIDEVIVVDDGSKDQTSVQAYNAGARVVRLERNLGKAAAMKAGIDAAPAADAFLFVDADTGDSARDAIHLLPPILRDQADLTVAVLPPANGKGGFGTVKRLATWGVYRGARAGVRAPLSGQRAVKADVMRDLVAKHGLAPRFGVEVAMTIDALNDGVRVAEIDVQMTHKHRGRGFGGFAHRAKQGKDVVRALWYRAIPLWIRMIPLAVLTALILVIAGKAASSHQSVHGVLLPPEDNVDVVLVPHADWPTINSAQLTGPLGSVVTGKTKDVYNSVAAGSRDTSAAADPDIVVKTASVPPASVSSPTFIVGVTVEGDKDALRPLAFEGGGVSGTLTSPSTGRAGTVDITDIAPTILAMEGKAIPASMTGTPMRVLPQSPSVSVLSAVDKMTQFYDRINPWVILTFVWVQIIAYLWALWASRTRKQLPGAQWVAAGVAAFPLATYVTRWILNTHVTNGAVWTAVALIFTAAFAYVAVFDTKSALTPLRRILLATIVFIAADVLFGTHLQISGTFGSSPSLGTRYHGLGNPASELLLLATVLWCGLHVQCSPQRQDALWAATSMLLLITVIIGAPGLGSDVGGLLTMVVTSIGLLAALYYGRLPWKWLGGSLLGAGTAVVCAAFIDYQRAPDARTHLGRLMARVINEGPSPLFDTIGRKIDANVLAYGFPWSLGVIGIVGFMLIGLLRGRWTTTLPCRDQTAANHDQTADGGERKAASPQRIALIAALAGSFVSYAVNDSGIVVLALVAVFVGPFVLVEYRHRRLSFERTGSKLEVLVP